jgi:nucleotide-binding universal stress UspA family protein
MNVLVAINDSNYSRAVIEEVTSRMWSPGTNFLILNVVAVPTKEHWQDWGLSVNSELEASLQKGARMLVEDSVEYLRPQLGSGTTIIGKVVQGHAAESIVTTAKNWHADRILIGAPSASGIRELVIGSTTECVILHAPCTVEVIRAKVAKSESKNGRKKIEQTTI